MAATALPCDFGWHAADFRLPGYQAEAGLREWSLADVQGPKGTLVVFICNHCPYVQAIIDRLVRDARDLISIGVGVVAISSNDVTAYPEDAFPRMVEFADRHKLPFPYLYDETQAIAKAYGAICTPDYFGFDAGLGLQYRGRLDASGRAPAAPDVRRELFEAMAQVATTGHGPAEQTPSIGCSIKWRAE